MISRRRKSLSIAACSLVICLMLTMLSACGGGTEASVASASQPVKETSATASGPASATEVPAADTVSGEAQPASADETEAEQPSLPLCQDTQTLSVWYAWPPPLAAIMDSPDGNPFYSELESRTNVHIDWVIVSTETASDSFNLMAISGEAPDMIQAGASMYSGGADKAVEDDFLLDCASYLDTFMPNLSAILEDETIAKRVLTPAGRLVDFPTINDIPEGSGGGLVCRGDWLTELGLSSPVTYDDYHDVLAAFKADKGASAPLLIPYTGFLTNNLLFAGYGVAGSVSSNAFIVDDGTVVFSPGEENFAKVVTILANWYSEGLIDADFLSRTDSRDPSTELIYGGQAGMFDCSTSNITVYEDAGGFELTPVMNARQDEAGTDYLIPEQTITSNGFSITANCKNPELAVRWIDYLYSKDGSFLSNYGIEGLTFNYDENGDPQLTELILKNPDGLPFSLAQCVYLCQQTPYYCHWQKLWAYFTDKQKEAYAMWNSTDVASTRSVYPSGAVMTSVESEEFTEIMSDVETYLEEIYFSVLVGEMSTDKLSELPAQLKSMNIARATEIKQAAYNRYAGIT